MKCLTMVYKIPVYGKKGCLLICFFFYHQRNYNIQLCDLTLHLCRDAEIAWNKLNISGLTVHHSYWSLSNDSEEVDIFILPFQ